MRNQHLLRAALSQDAAPPAAIGPQPQPGAISDPGAAAAPPGVSRVRLATARSALVGLAIAALAACAPQIEPEPPQVDPKADAKDAGGIDAEFAVKAFALGEPTLTASSPKNEATFPVLKGGGVNIDVTYTVSNFALGQVRCYINGVSVGQGTGTTFKFTGVKKGAHTLACVLADNSGTELTAPTARFALIAKVAEPCTLGSDCVDDNACSDEACVDLQCVYGIKLACCQSKYNCAAGETCVNANTPTAKCSGCTANADCNDNESCTNDTCDLSGTKGVCKNTMTDPECCSKATAPCDDGKSCTVDSCDTNVGKCKHVQPANVCCKDNDCSTADPCLVASCVDNECRTGPDIFKPECCSAGYNTTCDDKNYCTIDKCEKNMGGWTQCVHTQDATKPKCCDIKGTNAQCDDKQPCTNDFCDNYECKNLKVKDCCQQTLDCDDNHPCTLDACEIAEGQTAGLCTYKKIAGCCTTISDCDDNKFCTLDTCNYAALTCKYSKTDPSCCDTDAECDDGKLCTINACVNKVCVYSKDLTKPLCCESNAECSDGNPCTFDTCDLGAGALPVTAGLAAHYDARNALSIVKDGTGKVTEWKDLSGKGRHLTPNGPAPMFGDKLINGLPAIDFDGADRRMATAGFPLTTEVTVFTVIQWRKSDGWGAIAHHGNRDMDWSLEQNAAKQPGTTHFQSGNDNNGAELTLLENTNYILFGRVAGTKRTYAAVGGGSSYVESTADGNTIGQGTKVLFVGSSEISEDSHAYIGQILYYDKPLSDDDKNAVLNYLRKSWGIDATLAATSNTCKFQSNGQAGCCATNEECADNDCTTQDFCDGFNQCKHTLATGKCKVDLDCDDAKPCTQDKCITVDGCGQCQNVAQPAALCCDNDAYCDDKNPCTLDKCGSDNKCSSSKINECCLDDTDAQTACNDNNACTIEYCLNNQCRHTVPKNGCCANDADCNDSNGCTTDKCSNIVAGKGACAYVTTPGCNACSPEQASSYDDGNVCTADGCVLTGGVYKQTHTAIVGCCLDKLDCNDSKPCTYDYCIFNECVHTASEAGQTLCCDPATEAVDCAYLNTSCAVGKCQAQGDGALKCAAVEKTPCVVNLSYCQDFEGAGTVKSMGWLPGDVAGTAASNWGIAKDGPLGPDQYARLTWTPTKTNFLTCLQSPVVQAAGAAAITMQFDRSFLPAIANTTLTIRGSLGGASVDWNTAAILDGPIATTDQLGPEKLTIKLPPELTGSNGLRIAFCVAASSSLNFDEFAVDNVCIVKGGPPVTKNGCPANQSVAVGTKFNVPIKVIDPDAADIISFQLVSGPSFASVSSALYYWIDETWNSNVVIQPTQLTDVGDHTITVRYTDGFLQGLCTFKVTVTYQGGYLIWKPSEVPVASANAIKAALTSKGQFGQIISDLSLYPDLAKFNGVFITLGVYPDNHVLLDGEVAPLKAYLSGGGKVYMEGGDTFMFDTPTTLHSFFKIKGVLDSAPNGVTGPLKGYAAFADTSTSPPTPKAWAFDQGLAYNNVNDQIDGNLAVQKTRNLLKNDAIEKFWVAVGHDNPTAKYRTIGMSVPFGGVIASGTDTQTVMMERIITFFNNGFPDCKADTDCDDGNACTADKCATGACTNDNTCLCAAQTNLDCGAAPTKLVNNGGDSTQATSVYSCDLANQWLGKEVSYGFKATQGKPVTVELKNVSNPTKTRLFVLKATGKGCDPLGCIANDAKSITFAAGANIQYYVVVDTAGPNDTTQFDLSITCGQGEDCTNGKDDNANTLIDCLDKTSCCGDPACQVEICNGIDDNCSGTIDEGCDDDGDAWCDSSLTVVGKPPICVNGTGDCNDNDGTVNPGLAEICNNKKDDNCNTLQDEENANGCTKLWTDLDGDAFGSGASKCLCAASGTFKATKGGDCNDAKQTINPGMQETCATPEDDNCDGSNNDTNALGCSNFYTDIDGDAYGTTPFKCMCVGNGLVSAKQPGDCNDANAGVNPAIDEKCNAVDDNCNGQIDEGCDDDADDYCDTGLAYDPPAAGKDVCNSAKDGQTLTLACPAGSTITAIKYAEYGTVTGTCPTFTKGSCDAAGEINYIASNCIGKSSCSTINWHTVLGDPCGGVVKTMAVVATCSAGAGTASLDVCPKGPGDTDDLDPAINPEGKEICDGKDNNSDGVIDEDCDKDKDGYCDSGIFTVGKPKACPLGGGDCNDGNSNINPGMQENCKTADDDNCNGGNNDAGAIDCTPLFFDADGDKFGTNAYKCYCQPVGQYSAENPGDCNDDNKLINPNAKEICDNADNDCDKQVDNGCDDDGDLFCDSLMTVIGSPTVCANGNGDCIDTDAAVNPGKAEICNNGKDDNCNGSENDVNAIGCNAFYADGDGDTYGAGAKKCMCTTAGTFTSTNGADCDDTTKTINPGAPEACNDKDDNCDGSIDEGCDDDKDGYCDGSMGYGGSATICPNGGGDCDDTKPNVYKGKVGEVCDGFDDDCDGKADNGCDDDGDTYCDAALTVSNPAPSTCIKGGGDCDDYDSSVNPGAKEVCSNLKDDNCSGSQNDPNAIGCINFYFDADSDTYGLNIAQCLCQASGAYKAKLSGDCDDASASVAPGQAEKCDTLDNNCNGDVDEDGSTGCTNYFYDNDKDGYGLDLVACKCASASPYTASQKGDCDDTNPNMVPGKTEICDNIDNNCDTKVDEGCNADGDQFCTKAMTVSGTPNVCPLGGGDCDDTDKNVNPAGNEVCDGKDNNCNNTADDGCDDDNDDYCDGNMSTPSTAPTCSKGGGDCADNDNTINPGAKEVCGNTIDENCSGSTNDPNAVNCQIFFADFDGDGYGKGSTVFKKVAINEIRRNTNGFPGVTGNEFIEFLITADITATELATYYFGDSATDGAAKLGKYQLALGSLNLTTLKAGTIITVAGQGAGVAQDLTYNPAGADWNLTLLFDTSLVSVTAAGGDFAASDVAWIDTSSAGTTSIDSIRYGAATGALGAAAKTQLGSAPSNGASGTIAFTGDITGLNNAANYALDGSPSAGQPNGGANSTFVTWLRQVSSTGESQCLCIANSTYKTTQGGDCNDGNSNVFTGATEVCDGIDNNCNSVIDEGCDQDGDGYCDSAKITIGTPSTCPKGGGDCKDTDKTINPGAIESCADGVDTNCDGNLNGTGGAGCIDFYYDGDSDGYGANVKQCMCAANGAFKAVAAGDCDDTNSAVKPGVPENCATSYDDNCNGSLNDAGATNCTNFYLDADKDGYGVGPAVCACVASGSNIATVAGDCNDGDGQTNPGKLELCDGKDNNCNGAAPSAVETNLATGTNNSLTNYLAQEVVWTLPGSFAKIEVSFNAPTAQNVTLTIFKTTTLPVSITSPTPVETIGPVSVAQNGAGVYTKYTFTSVAKPMVAAGEKWVFVWKASSTGLTILESSGNQYPKGAAHIAPSSPFSWSALASGSTDVTFQAYLIVTGGTVDEGCDDDGDKYCDQAMETAVPAPTICPNGGNDCDDTKSTVNPGGGESCDDLDNNCNAATDETCDADGDQWCAAGKTVVGTPAICKLGKDDCDDGNKNIFPGKAENCDDLDNNCNGSKDEGCNGDNDGYCTSAMATIGTPAVCIKGGGDCKDADAAINPGAIEACDGIDNNCAGGVDEVCADLDKDGYCNGSVGCATCGNGNDGDFNATANQTLTAKGYNFKNFTIAAGVVVTVVGNAEPLLIRASNKIDIKGTLVVDGGAGTDATDSSNGCLGGQSTPGKGVAGGYDGGYGIYANSSSGAYPGNGPGPGKEGIYNFSGGCGSGGGGGGHGSAGANGGSANGSQGMGGGTYGSIDQDKLIGGSGGGAGGYGSAYNATGAGGGGGGGVVRFDAPDVIITGKVTANGGAGGWQKNNCDGGASGGGAGGAIWVRGNKVDISGGTLSALGGAAGQLQDGNNCGTAGGAGGNGRIRIDANTLVSAGSTSPTYSTGAKDGLGSPLSASCPNGGGDCNDGDKNVNPAASEDCNTATDDNCNGIVNESNAANCTTWYADEDLDGYGGGTGTCQCTQSKTLPTNIGGDCKDTDISVNPGQAEVCDNLDNDCKNGADNGCDDDGDLYCDNTMILKDTAKCTKSLTSCKDQAIWPPQYKGSPISMDTRSHGGGFNPFYKEYWYPEWSGGTIYRYDLNYQSKGTFNAGQGEIMQLWGDTDGDFYTANWGYYTVTKRKALSNQILWTYNIGYYAGAVTADSNYVYAMRADYSYTVHQLNKSTGALIKTFNLNGGSFGDWIYGGLAKVGDTFLVGRGNGVVWLYDANTLNNTGSYNVATNIYNMAFNGTDYLISANSSTVYSYKVYGNVCGQSCSSSILWPPKSSSVVNFNTQSHGGGYSPKAKEFWYPSWSGSTVYRYNASNYSFIGTFDSGQQQMMQLWGDTDGYYYTANWGMNTITKKVDLGSTTAWTYNMGESAGAVTADPDYVYALGADSMRVRRLNKATGALIDTFLLSGGGSETIYGGMAVGGPNLLVGRGSGTVYHYSLNQMTTGDIWPPVYTGAVSMDTRSHGGGYSPKDKEFWYPGWAGTTVYRYNEQYQFLGTFDSGQPQMMQLWGDTDGTYYTANWGYGTVTKMANKSGTRLWTSSLGQTMGGVTADENYVYAVPANGSKVWRLNKSNGSVVATYNFIGGNTGSTCHGGLAVVGDKLLVGRDSTVYRYNKNTYQFLDSFNVAATIYNMAYTGSEYCISNNSSTVWCYALYGKSVPLVSTFSAATNIYNMSFTGDKYCISNNSSTVYCYNVAGSNCTKGDDCDDNKSTTYPNATEICDNADSNCNNLVDDGCDDDNDNYCEAGLTIVGTPSTCTGGGGDCNDNTPSINPAPTTKENCATPEDDNCDGASDQLSALGCSKWYFDNDGDGQGTTAFECRCSVSGKYSALQSGDCDDNDPKQFSGTGVPKAISGVYKGAPITMETRSHGGGYSPTYNEYWYPEWAGYTIYRYDQQYNYKGTFNSGLPQMMQLWGDSDDTYYTANWGYSTINKWKGMGGNQVWSFNIGSTAGGVTADANNVYAMRSSGMQVWVLDKNTGGQVKTINLSGGSDGGMNGGMAVYGGVLYVGRDHAQVYRYDLATGAFIDQFATAANIYNMAFNGSDYCISNNSNQVHCYTIAGNTAPTEVCDGKDNNCNLVVDEGCDADKDGYCDAKLKVTSNAACPKTNLVSSTCLTMPPTYKGAPVTMETYSHGGGYSPKYNEYWYPNWASATIYRYNSSYQYLGSFNSGRGEIMQLWGDTDGTYYTANWGYNSVSKWSDKGATQLWQYNMPTTTGAVTADDTFVYAMVYYGMEVHVINKANGQGVKKITLTGGQDTTMYGGLAAVGDSLFLGRYNGAVFRYDKMTGQLKNQFTVATNIYNMAFNGKEYCISANNNQVYCYNLNPSACTFGDDCSDLEKGVNPGIKEMCDGVDNNCNSLQDEGCDDDLDGWCDSGMTVVGTPDPGPGKYNGAPVTMETYSHGGGFSPKYNEYWYPNWGSSTVYRYDKNRVFLGTFDTGHPYSMQLWGDTDGSYYIANWHYYTVQKKADKSSTTIWSTNVGNYVSAVTADDKYVYAMPYWGHTMWVLDKNNGSLIKQQTLNGGVDTTQYGGLAVVGNYFYLGRYDGNVYRYNKATLNFIDQFYIPTNINNMAFNGKEYCVSPNSSQVFCANLFTSGCVYGGGDCDDTNVKVNPATQEVCDGADNNCNKVVDEAGATGCSNYYYDGDQDGYGVNSSQCLCESGKQFKAVATPATYANARADCKAWGGDLVSIYSDGDNGYVRKLANDSGVTGNVWVGLSDSVQEGVFKWVSNETMTYSNWDSNEPAGAAFVGTTMLTPTQQSQLNTWYGNGAQKWSLCYRGTQDGFSSNTFHSKCDQYTKTLSILRDTSGNIFGGYNSGSWAGGGSYQNPGGTWLFSFKNNFKSDWGGNCAGQNYGTYNHPSYGPTFGGGHDLHVDSSMKSGYTYFGYSYYCPVGSCGNGNCMNYFSYQYSGWQLNEVEVYYANGTATGGPDNPEDFVYMKGSGKWADDSATATAGYVCSRSLSLFTAKNSTDCDDACSTCAPGFAEQCEGKDNNCNNTVDEGCDDDNDDFCDAGMVTIGTAPTCSKGGLDCNDNDASMSPGAKELCNKLDDNCNSITDEQAADGCPLDKNAVFKCQAGQCIIQSCATGFYDLNAAFSDGCECNGNDQFEPNDSCSQAYLLDSSLNDGGKLVYSPEGRVVTTDQDWYRVYAADLGEGGYAVCDKFNLRVSFVKQPGGLGLDVYRGSCPVSPLPGPPGPEGKPSLNSDQDKRYESVAGNQTCCGQSSFNWFTNFKGASGGEPSRQWSEYGECPCSTGDTFDQSNTGWSTGGNPYCMQFNTNGVCFPRGYYMTTCKDDSAWFYIKVYRPSGAPTCGNYKLEVSNGVYGQPGTGNGRKGW